MNDCGLGFSTKLPFLLQNKHDILFSSRLFTLVDIVEVFVYIKHLITRNLKNIA